MADGGKGIFWITGASSGIGCATALELARRGWTVIATARRAERLADLTAQHPNIIARPGDVTDRVGMAALVTTIEREHGPIAGALLNAGGWEKAKAGTLDADSFAATYALNVQGVVNCAAPLLPLFSTRKQGRLAIVASVAGYRGLPGGAYDYTSSKAALISLAESLAIDCGPRGVTVQVVNPGFVESELTAQNDHPMPFLLKVEDAARRIADGLAGNAFEIAFPRRTVWPLKLLGLLPACVYVWLLQRLARRLQPAYRSPPSA